MGHFCKGLYQILRTLDKVGVVGIIFRLKNFQESDYDWM